MILKSRRRDCGLAQSASSFDVAGVGSFEPGNRPNRGRPPRRPVKIGCEKLNHERPNGIRNGGLASK